METLTYSSTASFKTCRKKYYYSYNKRIEAIEKPLYFSVGSALHKGLECHYKGLDATECIKEMRSLMYENEPSIDDNEKLIEFEKSLDLVENIFKNYLKQYPDEPFTIENIEMNFAVPIINPDTGRKSNNYNFKGVIDGLVKESGKFWILEHKTTVSISNAYLKNLTLDTQSIAYLEAVERFLGIKIEGIIYSVMVKNYPRPPKLLKKGGLSVAKNQNTTLELYENAIIENDLNLDDYIDMLTFLQDNRKQYFYREYLTFNKKHIDEWRAELWDLQKDISNANKNCRFYKNTRQCNLMGTCQFWNICTALDEGYIIDNMFKKKSSQHSEIVEEFKPF